MTKKAYVQLFKVEWRGKPERDEYRYMSWSRDPKADKNTPYGGVRVIGDKYYQDLVPRCTGSGLRDYTTRLVTNEKEKAVQAEAKLQAGEIPYFWSKDLGLLPLELFY